MIVLAYPAQDFASRHVPDILRRTKRVAKNNRKSFRTAIEDGGDASVDILNPFLRDLANALKLIEHQDHATIVLRSREQSGDSRECPDCVVGSLNPPSRAE